MLELSQLANHLDVGEGQGIDTLDPRYQDIASLIEQADFAQAALKCQETFEELGGDIRLIAWFFFGLVLQDGVKALGPVFELATSIFRDRLGSVGPERKKDRHATSGMSWFLSKLADRVTSDDPDLQAEAAGMVANATLEDVQAAIAAGNELWQVFPEAVPTPDPSKVTNNLSRLRDWLEGHERELTPEPEPEVPEFEEPESYEAEDEGSGSGEGPRLAGGFAGSAGGGGLQVDASPRLAELQSRIAAFEQLMARGDVVKASLIACDIMDVVENFDPRVYLPRLFGGFFAQFARVADQVLSWQEKRGTAPWLVYDQLYRTNLEGFVQCRESDLERMLASVAGSESSAYPVEDDEPAWSPPPKAPPRAAPAAAPEPDGPSINDDW